MIHLIHKANRHLYPEALRAMHQERHRQFVLERGWKLRSVGDGEFDDYDDDLALYLVGFSLAGDLEVGCRLRPTESGGVLPDHFPHLIAPSEGPIRTPGVFECTRYFSIPQVRGRTGFLARSQLHLSMVECVRDRGGHRLLGFVDFPFLTHLRRFSGLRIRPIGFPASYPEGGETIAFEIGVSPEDLQRTRQQLDISTRQLFIGPPWLPAGADMVAIAQATALAILPTECHRLGLRELTGRALQSVVFQETDHVIAAMAKTPLSTSFATGGLG